LKLSDLKAGGPAADASNVKRHRSALQSIAVHVLAMYFIAGDSW
jgi:hypothetical protein